MNQAAKRRLKIYLHMTVIVAASLIPLTGCMGPLVKIQQIDPNAGDRVQVHHDKSIMQKTNVNTLGVVEATSCKNLLWQPESSLENCTDQLKTKAAQLGGNAIVLGYSDAKSADLFQNGINRNCWNTVDCSAVVILIKPTSNEMK